MRTKLRKRLSTDQAQINKRTNVHNQLQIALGVENVQLLDHSSIAEGVFPWTFDGTLKPVSHVNGIILVSQC
jgi:hypothetical protein